MVTGHIEAIRYTESAAIVVLTERRMGYKKKDGTKVDDALMTWRIFFATYFRKYISEHFTSGSFVKIKGTIMPYCKDEEGNSTDGCTVFGQTIDLAPYATRSVIRDKKLVKNSQFHDIGKPDLAGYKEDDF